MRDTFVKALIDIAENDKNVILVTGDLGFGVLKSFWEQLPDQFINAGIAEQNMTSMAAGLALEGKTVFTYSIGNFPTLRCLEQIRNDCAYHHANVKIVCVGGGFSYGSLGMSHHATEDLAIMRALPGVTVFAPADLIETEKVTHAIYDSPGTCYLRLGRGGEKRIHAELSDFKIGQAIEIQKGKHVAIFSTGAIFDEVMLTKKLLEENSIFPSIYTFPTVKPIDAGCIHQCAHTHELIVTVEEHNIVGGFGSAVSEILIENRLKTRLLRIGIRDEYSSFVGSQQYLRTMMNIDAKSIVARILLEIS